MQSTPEARQATGPIRVSVCVTTFRRPELLRVLLDSLAHLSFEKVAKPAIEIIIVDNDVNQSAKPVCQTTGISWPLRYVCEPKRGIVHARNRAIECAVGVDFVAFTDDDILPGTHWLDELLWTHFRFQADVVSGVILPLFANDVPKWICSGKFFDRPIFATGDPVRLCSTGNVLIHSRVIRVVPGFDERFNFSGAEDTHFFIRAREAGFRMVFSAEAVVYEPITKQRANPYGLLKRGFQAGNGWAHCEKSVNPAWRFRVLRVFKEFIHISRGTVQFLAALFTGKAQRVRSLQKISAGLGTLAGVAGYRYLPYQGSQQQGSQVPAQD